MIKFGITSSGPLASIALAREQEHRGWWPFAYTLLPEFAGDTTAEDEALLERLSRSMHAGGGVYRITRPGRFRALDDLLAHELKQRFGPQTPIHVHDMAASNAVTSLELFQRLSAHHPVSLHASDYLDTLYIVSLRNSGWRIVLDANLKPLQFVGHRMVLSGYRQEPARYPINIVVQRILRRRVLPRALALAKNVLARGASKEQEGEIQQVSLFHPRCIALATSNPRFTLGREDLFGPTRQPYHVIRVMNVLTTNHFPSERVMDGLRAICPNLLQGGLLVLGRNVDEEDGRLRATIFIRDTNKLVSIRDLNAGYELRADVESLSFCE